MAKKGDKYKCAECGLIIVVEDLCCCDAVELLCCEAPIKPVKVAAKAKTKDKKKLIKNPKVLKHYQKVVNVMNRSFGKTEQIKRFRLVPEEWSLQTGELTPTLKIKRRFIKEKYKDVIEEIYSVQKSD